MSRLSEARGLALEPLFNYVANFWQAHVLRGGCTPSQTMVSRLARWMAGSSFILWVEYLFYERSHSDLGPVLSVKAETKSWNISLTPNLRNILPIGSFLVGPYNAACERFKLDETDEFLSALFSYRIAYFLNLEANESDRVYQTRKTIMEETSRYLGGRHPFALRCAGDFAIERLVNFDYDGRRRC